MYVVLYYLQNIVIKEVKLLDTKLLAKQIKTSEQIKRPSALNNLRIVDMP